MSSQELYCAACDAVVEFIQPPCVDGHEECAEWACAHCGEAILLAPLTVVSVELGRRRRRRVAPHQRRAA